MSVRKGFTLIELLVATAIAMALAGACVTAFLSVRQYIRRAEARIAMYDNAQVVYTRLALSTGQLMQHCALTAITTADSVELTFMRGKEDQWDWKMWAKTKINSDMVWERWRWQRKGNGGILYMGSNQSLRTFTWNLPGYQTQDGDALPQPRRYLDPANPTATLNDNRYFPNTTPWLATTPGIPGDVGDSTDLDNHLVPVLNQVTDLAFELVNQDGTADLITLTPATQILVRQGVWMDGRIGDVLSATPTASDYATSAIAKRPKLLRLRFTLTDLSASPRTPLAQTFSFSFALPGLATAQ